MTRDTIHKRALAQMTAARLLAYVVGWTVSEAGCYRGAMRLDVLERLRADDRFQEGCLWWLHADVGDDLTEFRSYRNSLGPGALQIVVDQTTGAFYCDVDRFDPYQDVVNAGGHLFVEVLPDYAGRVFGWFGRQFHSL